MFSFKRIIHNFVDIIWRKGTNTKAKVLSNMFWKRMLLFKKLWLDQLHINLIILLRIRSLKLSKTLRLLYISDVAKFVIIECTVTTLVKIPKNLINIALREFNLQVFESNCKITFCNSTLIPNIKSFKSCMQVLVVFIHLNQDKAK